MGKKLKLKSNLLTSFLKSAGAVIMIWLIGAAVAAGMIGAEIVAYEQAGYAIVIMLLVSSIVGAKILLANTETNRVMMAALSSLMILILLFVGNWLLGVGSVGGVVQSLLVSSAGAACALMIGRKKKRKRYNRKY